MSLPLRAPGCSCWVGVRSWHGGGCRARGASASHCRSCLLTRCPASWHGCSSCRAWETRRTSSSRPDVATHDHQQHSRAVLLYTLAPLRDCFLLFYRDSRNTLKHLFQVFNSNSNFYILKLLVWSINTTSCTHLHAHIFIITHILDQISRPPHFSENVVN